MIQGRKRARLPGVGSQARSYATRRSSSGGRLERCSLRDPAMSSYLNAGRESGRRTPVRASETAAAGSLLRTFGNPCGFFSPALHVRVATRVGAQLRLSPISEPWLPLVHGDAIRNRPARILRHDKKHQQGTSLFHCTLIRNCCTARSARSCSPAMPSTREPSRPQPCMLLLHRPRLASSALRKARFLAAQSIVRARRFHASTRARSSARRERMLMLLIRSWSVNASPSFTPMLFLGGDFALPDSAILYRKRRLARHAQRSDSPSAFLISTVHAHLGPAASA